MLNPQVILDLLHRTLSPIREWLDDNTVTELMINPGGHVYIEAKGVITYKGKLLSETAIQMALVAIAKTGGKDAIAGKLSSIVNASIDDLRIAGSLNPTSPEGSFFTMRKHKDKNDRPTLDDLIYKMNALTASQAKTLERLIIKEKKNCIVAGGTGSGKTTLTNALLSLIPEHERIITIEDSRELQVTVPNLVNLLANPQVDITARELVKLAMRLRPDRLILGETRGDETYDLIRAFNSGHPGSMSTVHADNALLALSALEMLFQQSLPKDASMDTALVREYIAQSINVVVFAGKRIEQIDGCAVVVRKIEQIYQITGVENGKYQYLDLTHEENECEAIAA